MASAEIDLDPHEAGDDLLDLAQARVGHVVAGRRAGVARLVAPFRLDGTAAAQNERQKGALRTAPRGDASCPSYETATRAGPDG